MSQEQKDRVAEDALKSSQTPVPETASSEQQQVQTTEGTEVEAVNEAEEGSQADIDQSIESTEQTARPRGKKRARRKTKLVNVEEILPRPSLWPLGLAVSVAITLFGIIAGPIVCAIGVILVIVSIVGWALERR